ncbi:putative mitochondrial large ribosomal subunit [Rosellinia necatrix]|uniref:Putative mitochondrial large ribosomal subunit n=1 Tax=Rosellinia necatrix TaxID=77044 RepID=A0A1W2TCQ3_ROSNE|nr:putative mitochondrial large ribosomal subunit [Rosellinia necatrix]
MSLHLPTRQAANAARAAVAKPSTTHLQCLLPRTQRRHAWFPKFSWSKKSSEEGLSSESRLAQEVTKREKERRLADRITNRSRGATIFDEEIKEAEGKREANVPRPTGSTQHTPLSYSHMKEHMQMALDPDPRWRVRYQRKKIMQAVRANGKMSKEERIKATERELVHDGDHLPTSTKKLGHLARQVVGKTIDEALTQMRFSKKKMAREILHQIQIARDQAIVTRGMGLGAHSGETFVKRTIKTKEGKKIEVQDPTRIYIDEAWVVKAPGRGARIQYHARGRMSRMFRPSAVVHLRLKEEKTRIRRYDEKVAKEAKKAPWIHLPNRPVTAQRQYYSW